jgi:hypothetical protein
MSRTTAMRISNRRVISTDTKTDLYNFKPCSINQLPSTSSLDNINARLGDPYIIGRTLAPNLLCSDIDIPNAPSGLSYTSYNTEQRDIDVIKYLYNKNYNITLPTDIKIVFGCGSTSLAPAYIYALGKKLNKTLSVSSSIERTYGIYKNVASYIVPNTTWSDLDKDSDLCVNVSPNNPDGKIINLQDYLSYLQQSTVDNTKYLLLDSIYDSPQFTGQFTSVNSWVWDYFLGNNTDGIDMTKNIAIISSFSKLGISGFRYGYVLTRDDDIYNYMNDYIFNTIVLAPTAGAQSAFNHMYSTWNTTSWYTSIYNKLYSRYIQFSTLAQQKGITILNESHKAPYIYTDKSTTWWLDNYNVTARVGTDFDDSDSNYSRLSLMILDSDWNELIRRLSE